LKSQRWWTNKQQQEWRSNRIEEFNEEAQISDTDSQYEACKVLEASIHKEWKRLFDLRVRREKLCDSVVQGFVPECYYLSHIYPNLEEVTYRYTHWGTWDKDRFNFRVVGKISNFPALHLWFGAATFADRTYESAGKYNSNPEYGPLAGGVLQMDSHSPAKLSWDPDRQLVKLSFRYKVLKWTMVNDIPELEEVYKKRERTDAPLYPPTKRQRTTATVTPITTRANLDVLEMWSWLVGLRVYWQP